MSAPRGPVFLLEIGTEEIPDRFLAEAQEGLRQALAAALEPLALALPDAAWRSWSTPRRLAVAVGPVRLRQEDREEWVTGPPSRAAFDADGRPTRAAEGFARGLGLEPEALQRVQTAKGEYVAARRFVPGRAAAELLGGAAAEAVAGLHFPKMMRWGTVPLRFVRPIRWMVALLDEEIVPLEIAGVRSGRTSRGPRHAGSPAVEIRRGADYAAALRAAGVMADPGERRERIVAGLAAAGRSAGGDAIADHGLLEMLVHMTEQPAVIAGSFAPEFLSLPREVLVTAMRHHQRYFSVAADGALCPAFLAVLDRPDDPAGLVRRGHEWVLRARLSDARFFWQEDRKRPLEARGEHLARVIFQEKLGTYAEKVARLERLLPDLAAWLSLPAGSIAAARRAVTLAKNDLSTEMVKEFPELQGVMGGIYARADGEPAAVAEAIAEHYRPAGSGDDLPGSDAGRLLALADRLDTLAGTFAVGLEPTGTRDPYALRRAGLAVVRLLSELPWFLSLQRAVAAALAGYPPEIRGSGEAAPRLVAFLQERARQAAQGAGHRYDSVAAVLAVQADDPRDAALRLKALTALRAEPAHESAFLALAASFKRIRNLSSGEEAGEVDPGALAEAPEKLLHEALARVEQEVEGRVGARDYLGGLEAIASLRPAVDAFLGGSRQEGVLVLAPEARLRRNRLALLGRAARLFARIADFSEIVVEGGADPSRSVRPTAGAEAREA